MDVIAVRHRSRYLVSMMLQVDDDMIEMEKLSVDDRYEAHHHEEDDISHLRALRNTLQQTMEVHERRRTHIQVRRVPPGKGVREDSNVVFTYSVCR